MAKVIGIDLGTTYSAVSIWDEKRRTPVIIPNLQGKNTTPSVVSVNRAGEVVVGDQAKRNIWENPENTVSQIKREMGIDFRVTMNGKLYNPQTISAFILRYLKQCAEQYLGEPVYDAIITVPAYFKEVQKSATRDAGRIAGLNVHQLLNEPTAAAIAYGVSNVEEDSEKIYAVYDLGGGTFDVSIIVVSPTDINVIGTGGDPRLGGLDMDEAVMKWALAKIKKDYQVDLSGDEAARRRLKVEAEDVKRALVVTENATLSVPFLTVINGEPLNVELSISRSQFDGLILPLLKRSLHWLDEAVKSAEEHNGLGGYGTLDGVLLVGGPTRLSKIREVIREHLKEKLQELGLDKEPEIRADLNPDEVVAMGAAIKAAQLAPFGRPPEEIENLQPEQIEKVKQESEEVTSAPSVQIIDVTGHSLGIEILGEKFHRLIEKETPIPCQATHAGFTNAGDYASKIPVKIYQGEEEYVHANTQIGEVPIEVEPLPAGSHLFQIQFTLDISGTLSTIVTDLHANRSFKGKFAFDGITRMNSDEIKRKRKELEAMMRDPRLTPPKQDQEPIEIPELPRDKVPPQWYGYWLSSRDLISTLNSEQKQVLSRAMTNFAKAVMSGNAGRIEEEGNTLQDAYNEVQV